MGLMGTLIKAGLAKKAYDIARKPENQRRVKDLVGNARGKKRQVR